MMALIGGLEIRVLVLAPNNLASINYEWAGPLPHGLDVGAGPPHG